MNAISKVELPPYLQPPKWPEGTVPLARLSEHDTGARWRLEGDAQVTLVAKRMFPGARSLGPGACSFPNTPRLLQDLLWLMQRFPIEADVGQEDILKAACTKARDHAVRKIAGTKLKVRPSPKFLGTARKYQEECRSFCLANEKVLIADDTGLGKTVEAILLIASAGEGPALVVVEPHLVTQWMRVLSRFLNVSDAIDPVRIEAIRSRGTSKKDIKKGLDVLPDADVIVTHYSVVAYWRERLLDRKMRVVILDEVGQLRHRDTDKYNTCSLLCSQARYVAGLSATPIYNYGDEIWSVMNAIDFQCLGSRDDFIREWCTMSGAHHLVTDPLALGAYLRREGLMIRRLKTSEEVKRELPGKFRDPIDIDADDSLYAREMAKVIPLLKTYSTSSRNDRFLLSGQIDSQARRATGLSKVPGAISFLTAMLEAGEPVLVFAYHHDVVDGLMKGLARWNPRAFTGRETAKQKDANLDAFMKGKSKVLIMNLRSTSGIDELQQVCRVGVFVELDWSPAIHKQSEDRLWRDGQLEEVMLYYLVTKNGSDPDMQAKLGVKIGQAKGIMDDPLETEAQKKQEQIVTQSFVSKLIVKLQKDFAKELEHAETQSQLELA